MAVTQQDLRDMARNPRFMAERWRQRLAQNEKEYERKSGSLSSEEKKKKQEMLKNQYNMVKKYEKKAKVS
jgi:Lhr-like helicase